MTHIFLARALDLQVDILKQVIDRRLTRDFDYHKVPAPWMQIKLLRLLAITGADDQRASSTMYEVLQNCLAKAESQGSAAYAVVYECLCTITKIYPAPQLVGMAADSIGRFLKAENNNLKYLGITALVAVVQVNPAYAAEHQMVVIECLDDPDETLKRKTLELLCKMTNPANVTVITQKLVEYVTETSARLFVFFISGVFLFSPFFFCSALSDTYGSVLPPPQYFSRCGSKLPRLC